MASSRSSVIQFEDEQDPQAELKFQDLSHGESNVGATTLSSSASYTTFPDSADLNAETQDLLGDEKKQSSSVWEFSYYQSFFDVDTDQVLQRALWSMIPVTGRATFLDRYIRPKPDLYGPFWITATLIFSIAICGNIASYLGSEGEHNWSYDFHKVSLAATVLYSYAFLWPLFLWGFIWYRQRTNGCTLLETVCVFGYSLAIFVPISVLWIIQVSWLQYILVIVGLFLSGAVLLQVFWSILKEDSIKIAAIALCLIMLLHILLGMGFMWYFYTPSSRSSPSTPAPISIQTPLSVILPVTVNNASVSPVKVSRSAIDSSLLASPTANGPLESKASPEEITDEEHKRSNAYTNTNLTIPSDVKI